MSQIIAPIRSLSIPADPLTSRLLEVLSSEQSLSIFTLDAYLEQKHKLEGPAYHQLMSEWLASGFVGASELRDWLATTPCHAPFNARHFDLALRQAKCQQRQGTWVATWKAAVPPRSTPTPCPRVLFGAGNSSWCLSRVAFFNSRKAKLVLPAEKWLAVLRDVLAHVASLKGGVASSVGTVTYDLVTAYAQQHGLQLLAIIPWVAEELKGSGISALFDRNPSHVTTLTCLTKTVRCSRARRMVCRDRLLAFLSDLHCILEVRSQGNLVHVLRAQQKQQPRRQWIFVPAQKTVHNGGNYQLLETPTPPAEAFSHTLAEASPAPHERFERKFAGSRPLDRNGFPRQDYLYHYTRACPGPWPNQSPHDFLLSLLDNDPLSAHTALNTLVRILTTGTILASHKLVRGDHPVVSWTARSPLELTTLRQWNPGLIRWTFEPYGVAIKRKLLRRYGVKPAIYATSEVFARLQDAERYRFQLHEPPRRSWKYEREWRLPQDFKLQDVSPEDGFIFLANREDLDHLEHHVTPHLPVMVLDQGSCQ